MADGDAERPAGATPAYNFDLNRLNQADRITGIATLVLFISLFLPWFSVSDSYGTYSWNGLSNGFVYITLILCLAIMIYLVLRAGMGDLSFNRSFEHRKLILGATVLNFLIVLIGFFVQPSFAGISVPNVGWAYGSFIGLIAAVIAAAPSVMPIIQAQRLKSTPPNSPTAPTA